ncbi:lysozyme [Trinickia terrae]|uniref:Lysozyme n=1 Tax=Trinickia terrae TaxID=2571161 RepID=A0A4U1I130_9BURK|nr:lysozyme [Trinickia terrae]TKC86847.1 lysozyme [Trinickia terrae]
MSDNPSPAATPVTNTTPHSVVKAQVSRLAKPWAISADGIQFVADWEAFRAQLYDNDGAGHKGNTTIGYGHLVHLGPISGAASETPFKKGMTKTDAADLLKKDLSDAERIVNEKVTVPLYQYEYDALVDFIYNAHYHGVPLLEFVNKGQYADVTKKLKEYNKAGGKVSKGLGHRRDSESDLFDNGNYDASH